MQETTVWRGCNKALRRVVVRVAALAAFGVLFAPLTAYAGSVTLAWEPNPEWWVAGYVVYYKTASGVYSDSASVNVGNQTTAVINGLTNGVTYYFVVKAYSGYEVFSAPSNEEPGQPFSLPPAITNPGDMTVNKGSFTLPIAASDPEGDPLAFSATGLPSGLLINPVNGLISGDVTAGVFPLTANVSDGRTSVSAAFTLTAVNRAPTIANPGDRTVRPGAFTLANTASDLDGDPLTYSAPNGLPSGLTINVQTGEISGNVATGASGLTTTFSLSVSVSDGSASASVQLALTVVNQAPTVTNPGNRTVKPGAITLPVTASDPDGDPLAYSAPGGLPPGLTVNAQTGTISGNAPLGTFAVTVTASDGSASASVPFTLTVVQAPTITHPGNRTVKPGAFTLAITASDPNGDPLTYSLNGPPPGLTINAQTGEISGTVALGTYAVTATASDGSAHASVTFTLMVVKSPFTDDPLIPAVHTMRTVHITELRTRIDSLRAVSGLSAFQWTDPALGAGVTPIKAVHITELRSALNALYAARKLTLPTYADPALAAGSTAIKAAHISELRAAVAALE